ncbi:acyl-CoA dehydrogenase [Aspergillus udagawae]|nr:acyl-CoA dehydrogenase [Aspergillus udagawae]
MDAIPGGTMQGIVGENREIRHREVVEPGVRPPCGSGTQRRALRPMPPLMYSSPPALTELRSLLPPYEAAELLVDTYFDRVHWFMLIFQQDNFRQNWPHLYRTRLDRASEDCNGLGFLSTFLMVIAIGAHYAGPYRQGLLARHNVQPETLKQSILKAVKSSLLDVISVGSLEVVQTCILLGTYYLFHGSPRLAWPVCGCGLRVAQSLNLHRKVDKDHATLSLTPIERSQNETRKRCWWAIYEIETFCSMSYGYPHSIKDADCDVEPLNPSAKLRNAPSPVSFDEPLRCETTLLSYKYYMSKLSVLTKAVLTELYGIGPGLVNNNGASGESGSSLPAVVMKVASLDARLRNWRADIPPKLRWETLASTRVSYSSQEEFDRDIGASGVRFDSHIYHLQSLALKLAYENAMILTHRPLLSYRLVTKVDEKLDDMSRLETIQENPFLRSMRACHDAGMSLSELVNSPILDLVSETYAAAFVSIHTFTAGVALGILGSVEPLTPQAQEAKVGLHRLMAIQVKLTSRSLLATQGLDILQGLTRLVLDKELSMMLDISKPIRWPERHSGVDADLNAIQTGTLSPKQSSSGQRTRRLAHDAAGSVLQTDRQLSVSVPQDTQEAEARIDMPEPNSVGNISHLQYVEDASVSEALYDFDQVLSSYVNSSWADPDPLATDTSHDRTLHDEGVSMLEQTWIWGPDTLPFHG